tara:strand:+ start:11544 stop:12383 length:840 start_codon:yes stop_codon:yes gene_type:complete
MTNAELGEKYSVVPRSVRRWKQFLREEGMLGEIKAGPLFNIKRFNDWEKLEGDAIVASDFHMPFVDWQWASYLLKVAVKFDIRRLIIMGDLLDAKALTFFPRAEVAVAWETELRETENLIDALLEWFDEIVYCVGNHEVNRVIKRLQGQLTPERFGKLFCADSALKTSRYSYLELHTPRGKWRITHQKRSSIVLLTVARKLCEINKCHVMTHHQHRMAQGIDPSGTLMMVDNGMMVDEQKLEWIMLEDRVYPKGVQGFTVISNGVPYSFGWHTDWKFWL